ncbi:unnamed protein product [Lymnaea stagnalis]|uniref:C2H2-type domain-containing protein n=1 Tax=Lymnaea stagnalis TaxID=6523 RepID=A0AAV2I6X1_LYMST
MAETDQETGLLNGTVTHSLSDDNGMVDTSHVQVEHDGMSEELLRQALAEVNAYDSVSLAEASDCSEVCDTGQDTADANSDLGVNQNNSTVSHLSTNADGVLVHNDDQLLNGGSESIFHNGSADGLMVNGGSDEVMDVEANDGTFTVNIGSLPEGRIISIPNDIMTRSVIIPRSQHDQLHQTLEGNDDVQLLQDETNSVQQIDSEYINENDSHLLQTNNNSQLTDSDNGSFTHPHSITVSASSGIQMSQEDLQSVIQQLAQQQALNAQKKQSPGNTLSSQETISFTLVSPSQQNARSPPLGSSQNPIRIIQQGNRYTPMQQLTPEQLQQIMQVVQQQHVSKNSQDNGGAVIFNPQTNTRIMYRVIYPSELHKSQNSSTQYQILRPSTASQEQQTGTSQQKRPYRKRKEISTLPVPSADDEEKEKNIADAPELSKEEKEERKKHRPRTRSGRVSKPPKHMVQDYKHIHVLDWDEDYDDSDGGYSDFKHSDEEKSKQEGEDESLQSPELFPALGAGRPRNHKCQTCEKSYIGQAGLNRHYRLNPDHCINPSENGSISSIHNGSIDGDDSKGNNQIIENYSEDSNTQDSLNSLGATSPVVRRGRGRGSYRGRWAHLKHNAQIRRKNKLKELMKHCTDEDLMEVVLPRLVNSISLWEYLMMKSEKGGTRPQIDVIYREFETLRHHVKKACADYMHPMSQEELEDDNLQCKMIKVADKSLALCLDLEPVTYMVREMPPGDSNSFSSLHNKLSAAAIATPSNNSIPYTGKDAAERVDVKPLVSQHPVEQGENPAKKPRISQFSCPNLGKNLHTTSPLPVISNTFTVTAQLPLLTEENGHYARSDSSLSSISSLSASSATSPQSQPVHIRVASSNVTSSTIPALSSQSFTSSSSKLISTPTTSSGRSPFVHIACPTTKTQTVSYILADPKGQAAPGVRGVKTQPVPVFINQPAGAGSQMLPSFIMSTSGSLTGLQQKYIVATPRSQPGTPPVVLSTANVQQAGTTTMLVTTASPTSGHRVIVRQPPPPHVHQTRIIIPSPSKAQTAAEASAFTPTTVSSGSNNSRSLLNTLKPTEVKVSRQLFHDTTSANAPTVTTINGRSNIKTNNIVGQEVHGVFQQLPARTTSISSSAIIIGNGTDGGSRPTKLVSARTLVTPPSGQQFITSPNKAVGGVQVSISDGDMDDIEVLGSMEFPDDLGTMNTSSDSLNCSLSAGSQSVVNDMAATSSVSEMESFTVTQAADSVSNLVDMTGVTADSQFGLIHNGNINGLDALTYMNGSSSEFPTSSSVCLKIKDSSINSNSPLTFSVSTSPSTYASSVSDFINISKPSSMVFTSALKEGVPRLQTSYCMDSNTTSQEFKPDTSSITMADITSLQFGDQGVTSGHLNGNSILQSDDQQEDTINMLSDQLTSSDPQEADIQFLDSREAVTADGLIEEEENQLLLSEGSSIYQTEDGTVIIQSANGNTYQLQGTQGFSLETVQALLSGTLDQLSLGDGAGDNVQTDVQML